MAQAVIRWGNQIFTFSKVSNECIEHIRDLMLLAMNDDMHDLETLLDGACFKYEVVED